MLYREAIDYLLGLQKLGVKLGLENIRRLLEELAHPERSYPVLLITGSNGKGSVAAMASAALHASGLRVGTYTSPHLVRLEERIAVDGQPITARRLTRLTHGLRRSIDAMLREGRLDSHPTFFETVTAIALEEFRQRKVDIAVLEVGLGGRFDATNATQPTVSVVTTIALEHTRYLGETLEEIAFEKAGIARSDRPLVSGLASGKALAVLREQASRVGAQLIVASRRVKLHVVAASRKGLELEARSRRGSYPRIRLPLPGRHQAKNAQVAIAALEALPASLRPSPAASARGLGKTRWPGRLEYIAGRPRFLLDGAHNPHATAWLASYLSEFEPGSNKVLLFACLGDKNLERLVEPLFRLFTSIVVTGLLNPRAVAGEELRHLAPIPERVDVVKAQAKAIRTARTRAGRTGLVVVTGSLYLVGDIKARILREAKRR